MSIPFGFVGGTVGRQNLPSLQKGGDWSKSFTFTELDQNGAAVSFDWTGCTLTMYIFVSVRTTPLATLTGTFSGTAPATKVIATFTLTAAQTAALPSQAQWELWLTDAAGNKDCLIFGNANTLQLP